MDALSDVLSAVRLTGAVFLEMELRAQWSYLTAPAREIADVLGLTTSNVGFLIHTALVTLRAKLAEQTEA